MIDPWLLFALALAGGAPLALAPGWTATAAVLIAAQLRRRGAKGWQLALMLATLALSGARASADLDAAQASHAETVELLTPPERCEATAYVESSPVVLRRDQARRGEEARIDLRLTEGRCGDKSIERPFVARVYGAPEDLVRGDRVELVADLGATYLFLNEGSASPLPRIVETGITASGGAVEVTVERRGRGPGALVDRVRRAVRARIEATYHPEAQGLGRALVLGESDLDGEDDLAFRMSGLSHLLAVSGTHLVLAVLTLGAALRALLVRVHFIAARLEAGRLAAGLMIPLAWLYADFAGGSGSAERAAGMLSVVLLAKTLGRRPSGSRAFSLALCLFAAADPLIACDISFALSCAATAGLLALERPIEAQIARIRWLPRPIATAIAATVAATIPCTPIIATMAPTMPTLGVLANLLAAPVGELAALPICLLHAVLGFAPSAEQGAATLGSGALLAVRSVARASTAAPGAFLAVPSPTSGQLAAMAVAAFAVALASSRRGRLLSLVAGLAALVALEGLAIHGGRPRGGLRVTSLDVGQGDSTLVDLPDGRLMLIDGGGFVGSPVDPGARVILPLLRARRRSRIDIVVLSHPHPDHFGGLVSALPQLDVGEFWDTGQGQEQGAGPAYDALIAGLRARKVPIRRPIDLCGQRRLGAVELEVFAPCPGFIPDEGANDNSFVFRLSFGDRRVLLSGDAEHAEEGRLIAAHAAGLDADLLKVGHHGSRTSTTPEFVRVVSPTLAVISTGVRNRYGHPHPNTLATLSRLGVPIARTDRGGELTWETDGEQIRIERPARWR